MDVRLPVDPACLPEDIAVLQALVAQLLDELRNRDGRIEDLEHRMDLLLRRIYGRTSEKFDPNQLLLFLLRADESDEGQSADQAPAEAPSPTEPPGAAGTAPARKKGRHGRRRLPDELKRVEMIHDLTPAEKELLGGAENLVLIGREETEQLEWEPSSLYVIRHVQLKYVQRDAVPSGDVTSAGDVVNGDSAATATVDDASAAAAAPAAILSPAVPQPPDDVSAAARRIITGQKPPQPIPGGLPGPGLIAHAATAKYVDHTPLNRQERQYERHGLSISRQTTCDWLLAGAELLWPLYTLAKQIVVRSAVVHLDATSVKIRDARKKLKRTGYFWPCIGDDQHALIAFHYTPTHCREGPAELLRDFRGHLQVDAHSVYDELFRDGRIVEVDCWMHARRNFFDARRLDRRRAETALAYIGQLYAAERKIAASLAEEWRDLPREDRFARILAVRQEESKPVLDKFFPWIEAEAPGLLPKNPLRQAMEYALRQRPGLLRYCDDGRLAIDNGAAERTIRGIALGRRNWLFCGSERGARAACVYFTLAASCRRNGKEPFAYLRDILARMPILKAECGGIPAPDVLRSLLPDLWQPAT
jgi:transposase